jgi:hypothetical protein
MRYLKLYTIQQTADQSDELCAVNRFLYVFFNTYFQCLLFGDTFTIAREQNNWQVFFHF